MSTTTTRPIHEIADEIARTWRPVNYAARPYLQAMAYLNTVDEYYFEADARGIVAYFLSNASSWRGDDARRIKAELRALIKR